MSARWLLPAGAMMTFGTIEEIKVVRRYVSRSDFREALEHAPPGVMDERSWAYWNIRFGHYPVPPMPHRSFDYSQSSRP
jgi:hypothetical protein